MLDFARVDRSPSLSLLLYPIFLVKDCAFPLCPPTTISIEEAVWQRLETDSDRLHDKPRSSFFESVAALRVPARAVVW